MQDLGRGESRKKTMRGGTTREPASRGGNAGESAFYKIVPTLESNGANAQVDYEYERLHSYKKTENIMRYLSKNEMLSDFESLREYNPVFFEWKLNEESPEDLKGSIEESERKIREIIESNEKYQKTIEKILFDESKKTYDRDGRIIFSDEIISQVSDLHRILAVQNKEVSLLRRDVSQKKELLILKNEPNEENMVEKSYLEFLKQFLSMTFEPNVVASMDSKQTENFVKKSFELYNQWAYIERLHKMYVEFYEGNAAERPRRGMEALLPPINIFNVESQERSRQISYFLVQLKSARLLFQFMEEDIERLEKKNGPTNQRGSIFVQNDFSSLNSENRKCGFRRCNAIAPYVCGHCEKTFYCSKGHQERDWIEHKRICREI
jgi:hypothetical protein